MPRPAPVRVPPVPARRRTPRSAQRPGPARLPTTPGRCTFFAISSRLAQLRVRRRQVAANGQLSTYRVTTSADGPRRNEMQDRQHEDRDRLIPVDELRVSAAPRTASGSRRSACTTATLLVGCASSALACITTAGSLSTYTIRAAGSMRCATWCTLSLVGSRCRDRGTDAHPPRRARSQPAEKRRFSRTVICVSLRSSISLAAKSRRPRSDPCRRGGSHRHERHSAPWRRIAVQAPARSAAIDPPVLQTILAPSPPSPIFHDLGLVP